MSVGKLLGGEEDRGVVGTRMMDRWAGEILGFSVPALFGAIALAVHLQDVNVVSEPVQ